MKILHVATILNTINLFLIPHIKFLIEQGHTVDVACNTLRDESPELTKLGSKIHHVSFQRNPLKYENVRAHKQIQKLVEDEGYDLIHVHTPIASFLARMACRNKSEIKMLYTAHGFHFFKGAPLKNKIIYYTMEKIAARWTDGLITMNEEDYVSAKKLKLRNQGSIFKINGIGLNLQKYIPQTIEKKVSLRKLYGYKDQDFILIYVGELCYRKHQDLAIKAISLVKERIPNLKLLLVGSGSQSGSYKALAEELGVEENIKFLGYREDVPNLMSISDLAVSTSRQEGLPVNVMEAMATGIPLIVTNCRGNRDLVSDGINGFVTDVDDALGFASAIERLYTSQVVRKKFSSKNKEIIQTYSVDYVINEVKGIYENYCNEKEKESIKPYRDA